MPSLLVATGTGLFVYEDGTTRSVVNGPVRDITSWDSIRYAITNGNAILIDDGEGTELSEYRPDGLEGDLTCIEAGQAGIFVGTDRSELYRYSEGERTVIESFQACEDRENWYTPWGDPASIRSIAMEDHIVYVNVHVGGILRGDRTEETWKQTIDIDVDVHEVTLGPSRDRILAATARGLAVSRNRGEDWTFFADGLHATYARAVAAGGETLYVSASKGPGGEKAALYRSPLEDPGAFRKCTRGLPDWFSSNIDTGCIAAEKNLVWFGTRDGALYISRNRGDDWWKKTVSEGSVHAVSVLRDSSSSNQHHK